MLQQHSTRCLRQLPLRSEMIMKRKNKALVLILCLSWAASAQAATNKPKESRAFLMQSRAMAYAVYEIVVLHQEESRFPVLTPTGGVNASETASCMRKDFWNGEYYLEISPSKMDMLIASYGSDGVRGGNGTKADWIYELSITTNTEAIVRILESPDAELSRSSLTEVFVVDDKRSYNLLFSIHVEMPSPSLSKRLDNYSWLERDTEAGCISFTKHIIREHGFSIYFAVTLLAAVWFWYQAVFKKRAAYLILVSVLCLPLIFFLWHFSGGFFMVIGFATLVLNPSRAGKERTRYGWSYFVFSIVMFSLAVLSALII